MNNLFKSLIVAASLLIVGAAAAADYTVLSPAQPTNNSKKIEVLEFFFYGCSHCFHLHPQMSAWEKTMPKDVELIYVPAIFRDSWEPMARTFYALESIGQLPQLHEPLFKAWNVDNLQLFEEKQIVDFVGAHGVDKAKFSAAYNSFSMQSKVNRAKQMIRSYAVSGTPTLVVDGQYAISGLQPADTMRVLNELIAKVRKERPGAAPEGKTKAKR